MISNQIIQTSIDELKAITKVDIYVFDLDGIKVAATTEDIEISREIITGFAASPADSQVVGGYHFLRSWMRENWLLFLWQEEAVMILMLLEELQQARSNSSWRLIRNGLTGTISSRI